MAGTSSCEPGGWFSSARDFSGRVPGRCHPGEVFFFFLDRRMLPDLRALVSLVPLCFHSLAEFGELRVRRINASDLRLTVPLRPQNGPFGALKVARLGHAIWSMSPDRPLPFKGGEGASNSRCLNHGFQKAGVTPRLVKLSRA